MARTSNNGGNRAIPFAYNPVLGWLLESGQDNDAKLGVIRKQFPEEDWKKGYTGNGGTTAAARKAAREAGLKDETLSGAIVAAYFAESESNGVKYQRIRVKIVDGDEAYLVSFRLDTRQGQLLVQKLISVVPGDHVTLTAFGSVGDNGYANHAISLKDGAGKEIKGPEGLFKEANTIAQAKVEALKDAVGDDKKVINAARAKVFLDFHKDLLDTKVAPKFDAFGKTDKAADNQASPAGGSESEQDDDIPF